MRVTVSCAGNYQPAHIFPRLERTEGRAGRPHPHRHRNYHPNREYMKYIRISPNVEYSTDTDFFLENQIICIVSKEGTKFCSLIENRLFMRSENRHISKRMQLDIMREIHKDICRLCYGRRTGGLTCHTPHLNSFP